MNPNGEPVNPSSPGGVPPAESAVSAAADLSRLEKAVNEAAAQHSAQNTEIPPATSVGPVSPEVPAQTSLTPEEQFNNQFGDNLVGSPTISPVNEKPSIEPSADPSADKPAAEDSNVSAAIAAAKILAEAPAADNVNPTTEAGQAAEAPKTPERVLKDKIAEIVKLGAEEQERKMSEAVNDFLEAVKQEKATSF